MKRSTLNYIVPFVATGVVILIVAALWPRTPPVLRTERMSIAKASCYCYSDIYARTGILPRGLMTAQIIPLISAPPSAYPPFRKPSVQQIGFDYHFQLEVHDGRRPRRCDVAEPVLGPETTTRVRKQVIINGVGSTVAFAAEIAHGIQLSYDTAHTTIIFHDPEAVRLSAPIVRLHTGRPGISGDLPRSPADLRRYIQWLNTVYGPEIVLDGRGHPMTISLKHQMIVFE